MKSQFKLTLELPEIQMLAITRIHLNTHIAYCRREQVNLRPFLQPNINVFFPHFTTLDKLFPLYVQLNDMFENQLD